MAVIEVENIKLVLMFGLMDYQQCVQVTGFEGRQWKVMSQAVPRL